MSREAFDIEAALEKCHKGTAWQRDLIHAQLIAAQADAFERAERYRAALREVEPYIDAIICYASTQGEHHPNKIAADIRATLAEGESG